MHAAFVFMLVRGLAKINEFRRCVPRVVRRWRFWCACARALALWCETGRGPVLAI